MSSSNSAFASSICSSASVTSASCRGWSRAFTCCSAGWSYSSWRSRKARATEGSSRCPSPKPMPRNKPRARPPGALVGGGKRCGHRRISLCSESRPEHGLAQTDGRGGEAAWRRRGAGAGELHPTDQAQASDAASPEELRQNWPRFRGADGSGVSMLTNVPATWDAKTGAGIAWKVPAPASGFNSPIVWGDRVFFSGGDARKREVLCLDGKTGQMLWRQPVANVPGAPAQRGGGPGVHRLCRSDHGDGRAARLCDLCERRLRGVHPGRASRSGPRALAR